MLISIPQNRTDQLNMKSQLKFKDALIVKLKKDLQDHNYSR